MPQKNLEQCVDELVSLNMKIAFAESATAGRLASEFALIKDSGKILLGGIVCYDSEVKTGLLNIPQGLIDTFTAESAEVTQALAQNLRTFFKADVIVAVTGLASPGGSETEEKPVGTMFFHILMPERYVSHRELFTGTPEEVILAAIDKVSVLIIENLQKLTEHQNQKP